MAPRIIIVCGAPSKNRPIVATRVEDNRLACSSQSKDTSGKRQSTRWIDSARGAHSMCEHEKPHQRLDTWKRDPHSSRSEGCPSETWKIFTRKVVQRKGPVCSCSPTVDGHELLMSRSSDDVHALHTVGMDASTSGPRTFLPAFSFDETLVGHPRQLRVKKTVGPHQHHIRTLLVLLLFFVTSTFSRICLPLEPIGFDSLITPAHLTTRIGRKTQSHCWQTVSLIFGTRPECAHPGQHAVRNQCCKRTCSAVALVTPAVKSVCFRPDLRFHWLPSLCL